MLTDEAKQKIHVAMEAAGGSIAKAAILLGVPREELKDKIHDNNDLRARWTTSRKSTKPTTEAVVIHRPLPARTEEELAEAMAREDALVRSGLESMRLKPEARDLAMALQRFHRQHFTRAIEMLGGGITKSFLDVMVEVEKINNELAEGAEPEREAMLRADRAALLEILGKYYDRATAATLAQAKVKLLKKQAESEGDGKRAGKPGFRPLVAVAVKGENVQVSQSEG